jgi:hypothetical protein
MTKPNLKITQTNKDHTTTTTTVNNDKFDREWALNILNGGKFTVIIRD